MALLVMKDKRLTRPLIIDYFDNSNLLTYEFRYEFCQTSVSLYFPPDFKLQGHQRRDEDCQPSTYDLLWFCSSKNITNHHTPTPHRA